MTELARIGNFQVQPAELVSLLMRYQMIPAVVRELAIDRAIADLECNQEEELIALKQLYERYQLTSEERLQQWLDLQGLARPQLAEIAIRNFKLEKFKNENWNNKLESYFLKRKGQLDRIVYSLIRTDDLGIAQEIYFRSIDDEQNFPELAREYSQGAEAKTGGLIGPVEMSTPHPQLVQLFLTQPVGKICPPIQLEQWYVIVRSEQIIPAKLDDPMRQRLIAELFQTWLEEQIKIALMPNLSTFAHN